MTLNKSIVCISLSDLLWVKTVHGNTFKKVILDRLNSPEGITQLAYGQVPANTFTDAHVHKDMDECYLFTLGMGVLVLDGNNYNCEPGIIIRVPAGVNHSIVNDNNQALEFYYFGVENQKTE